MGGKVGRKMMSPERDNDAATHSMKEALWLRSLLTDIFGPFKNSMTMLCNNQSAIALAHNNQYHARTKHIDVRFHFIHWVVEQVAIWLVYCPTKDMVANALTKVLPSPKVKHFATGLGLHTK